MDFIGSFGFAPPKIDLLLLSLFVILGAYVFTSKRKYKLPPGPKGLPFVGYLPFVGHDPPSQFQILSKKYGDVFSVYLGRQLVIVVTDVIKAKELLSRPFVNDRPEDMFHLLPGGAGIIEHSDPQWTEQRRYTLTELKNLTFGKSAWEKLLEIEVRDFQDLLEQSDGKPIHIDHDLGSNISNNILSLVTGRRIPAGDPGRDIIQKGVVGFERIYDQSGFISYYPKIYKFLSKLGLIDCGQMLEDMENMNKFVRREIKELEQDKDDGVTYIQKYFAEIEKNKRLDLKNYFDVAGLIGNVQALIMAASDTTTVSIQWLLLAMASFPDIQAKIHEELDLEIGKDGAAKWIDRNKLPYTHATILEGQRWRTVVPLSVTHRVTKDMQFSGYDIPKGAHIITVFTAFHTDTRFWKDPEKFQPERFIKNGKTVSEPEGYLPFSHGKRKCPGMTVGLIEVFYYFVAILQKFQVLPPSDSEPPNLEGHPGLTFHPMKQRLRFVLR